MKVQYGKVCDIPLDRIFIKENIRFDTDDELGEQITSMGKYGQLQNAGVYPRKGCRFELVFGHRRYRSALANNDATLSCLVLDPEVVSESDIPVIKLQENMIRKQLTNAEILKAADAIIAAHPGMTDKQCDLLLGKKPGWLAFRRSTSAAYNWLAEHAGLSEEELKAMNSTEVINLRARMEHPQKPARANSRSFHRGDRIPREGFNVIASDGPNVIVVCPNKSIKNKVLQNLYRFRAKLTKA